MMFISMILMVDTNSLKNKFYEILEKNIFSIEWRIEQARRNFEKSKEYQKDILDKRRFDFFEKVKNS